MPAMLKHKSTGDLYLYTAALAKRDDMELVEEEKVKVKPQPKPVAKKKSAQKKAVTTTAIDAEDKLADELGI